MYEVSVVVSKSIKEHFVEALIWHTVGQFLWHVISEKVNHSSHFSIRGTSCGWK